MLNEMMVFLLPVLLLVPLVTSKACNGNIGDDAAYTEGIKSDSSGRFNSVRRIVASGCPNYPSKNAIRQNKDLLLEAYPCFSDKEYDVQCVGGAVGITLNGISIFSKFAGGECTADNDAVVAEGDTFDACSGHASPQEEYHYHIAPSCLLDQLGDYHDVTKHSPLVGWAFDGFPIYGPHGVDGELISRCTRSSADSSDCVDRCNGHAQHEIDGYLYHYHLTGPIGDLVSKPTQPLPTTEWSPYTIGCLKGVVADYSVIKGPDKGAKCAANGTVEGFVPRAMHGVTRVYGSTQTPTSVPSTDASAAPTEVPSDMPSVMPTEIPTDVPSTNPSGIPTSEPTRHPIGVGSQEPTKSPTSEPTHEPTDPPSADPSASPSADPTVLPSNEPTSSPTPEPSADPSAAPIAEPTDAPTKVPSAEPTASPSAEPTKPTRKPTREPTEIPTEVPTNEESNVVSSPLMRLTLRSQLAKFESNADRLGVSANDHARDVVRWAVVGTGDDLSGLEVAITSVFAGSVKIEYVLSADSHNTLDAAISNINAHVAMGDSFPVGLGSKSYKLLANEVVNSADAAMVSFTAVTAANAETTTEEDETSESTLLYVAIAFLCGIVLCGAMGVFWLWVVLKGRQKVLEMNAHHATEMAHGPNSQPRNSMTISVSALPETGAELETPNPQVPSVV